VQYNFDEIIERRNTNCIKWDRGNKEVLPMWVADMDFRAAEPIQAALEKTLKRGIFGYAMHPEEYYNAIRSWFKRRHNWNIEKEWILFGLGVVPALSMLIRGLTEPGDKVIIQPPVYYPFFRVVTNNNCEVYENLLKLENGKYVMDYEDLERKASDPKTKLMILCNPQNPGGRVWSKEELKKLGEICLTNNVLIISDEIHCDLLLDGNKYTPFASINEDFAGNSIICTAPSKTFNLAGLQVSNLIVSNKELRSKVKRILEVNEVSEPNIFSSDALVAAYNDSEEWLDQLLEYLLGNLNYLNEFMSTKLPNLKVMKPEATYLVWVDCRELKMTSTELTDFFKNEAKVWFNDGKTFGVNGDGFVRINIACPREILIDGLNRVKEAVDRKF
jgi:Bifunctional PLP-dependent enzyme with beta-cystathionase and maltose regulon repressor activities